MMKPRAIPRLGLVLILLLYATLAAIHSYIAPLTTGNDEWAHFLYVRFIAEQGHLPATPAGRNEAGYKSDAPALYHLLAAAVTSGIEPTRLLRPLDAPRRYLADNIVDSYALLHTAVEQPPYQGEVLIWHMGRLLSILFGLALIGLTYLTGLRVFAARKLPALLAAALVAFTPAVLFHSSVLSYESLSAALTALFLLVALKILEQTDRPGRWRWWLALGVLAGLSLTTKYSAALLPLEILVIAWLAPRTAGAPFQWPHFTGRVLLAGVALLIASAWWFGFVIWHFNTIETRGPLAGVLQPLLVGDASDTTSVRVAGLLFGQEAVAGQDRPPLARNYPQLTLSFLESFWAAPVAGRFVGSPWLPLLFSGLALAGLAGLWRVWPKAGAQTRAVLILLLVHAGLILPLLALRVALSFDPREAAQGRHVLLPAASAIAVLLVWGWAQWSPKLAGLAVGGLLLWTALIQVGLASLAYPPPIPVWSKATFTSPPPSARPRDATLAGAMHLTAVDWRQQAETLEVTLWWEALAVMPEDYLVELSLLDQAGRLLGYDLSHPVRGRYPTRAWTPPDVVQDIHRLPLTRLQPGAYRLQLHLLDRAGRPLPAVEPISLGQVAITAPVDRPDPCAVFPARPGLALRPGFRPRASFTVIAPEAPILSVAGDPASSLEQAPLRSEGEFHVFMVGPDWPASAQLFVGPTPCGDIFFDIPPRNFTPPDIPTPLQANFNGEIELLGYDLPARRIQPGQRLPLTLYWRALDYMGQDYRLFANPLDARQQRWGGYDRRPRDGYSTLRWVPGELIVDPFGIPIQPEAPPGIYTVDLGFYQETAAGAESLPLVEDGRPLEQRSLRLGPIKVGGPPPDLVVARPAPQFVLNQSLGDRITLLGYDVTGEITAEPGGSVSSGSPSGTDDGAAPDALRFTFYWQVEAAPAADYTVFLHLRDASNQNVAQQDSPPAAGRYPTSLWDAGEIIKDEISLPVAGLPPGRYRPVIGLYEFTTGQRLPAPGQPDNEIPLEPVTLQR